MVVEAIQLLSLPCEKGDPHEEESRDLSGKATERFSKLLELYTGKM